jgi:hypothetical protein
MIYITTYEQYYYNECGIALIPSVAKGTITQQETQNEFQIENFTHFLQIVGGHTKRV